MPQISPALSHDSPRRHPRVRIKLTAELVWAGETARAVVGDISEGGAFVSSPQRPATGTPVSLRFRLLNKLDCEAIGRVVWSAADGFGVEFDALSKQMASFTESISRMPAQLRELYLAGVLSPRITVG